MEKKYEIKAPYHVSLFLFICSLLYLYSELIFNVLMLDVAGTSHSNIKQIDDVQYYGRMISANGFTLLLLGLFARSGFRLWKTSHWWIAGFCMFICSIPFFMIFGASIYGTILGKDVIDAGFDATMGWSLMVVPGVFLFLKSGGHNRALVVLGLIVMAWPAMFFGQKLLVERYVVAPTSWEDRLGARYVLMARAKSEDCAMTMGEIDTCGVQVKGAEMLSLNAIIAAFLLNAKRAVLTDISEQKDDVLLREVIKRNSAQVDALYMRYLKKIDGFQAFAYSQFKKDKEKFIKEFYIPYLRASRQYEKSISEQKAAIKLADELWDEIERKKNESWLLYWREASNYNTSITGLARKVKHGLIRVRREAYDCDGASCEADKADLLKYFRKEYNEQVEVLEELCDGNILEYNCKLTEKDISEKLHEIKDKEFIEKSGYLPSILTQADFFALPKNVNLLQESIKKYLQKNKKSIDIEYFKSKTINKKILEIYLKDKFKKRADIEWIIGIQKALGEAIPPSLDFLEFVKVMGIENPLKDIEKLNNVLTKQDFMEQYVLPSYKAEVVKYFEKIEKDAPYYANGERFSRKGKDYIRAVYVPPIALGLSLFIVVLTVGKNLMFLISSLLSVCFGKKEIAVYFNKFFYLSSWLVFIYIISILAEAQQNIYIQNKTYEQYYQAGYLDYPNTTVAIDTIIRVQPIIYRQGNILLDFFSF